MSETDNPYLNQPAAGGNLKTTLDNLVEGHIRNLGTSILVKVQDVKAGDSFAGFVDVLPMVHQQDAQGRPFPHGTLHDVPYMRIQGGASALIIDPQPGDIGFIVVAGRDMTHAITNRTPSPPASFREFAMQDAVYIGGFLNSNPTQYIQATSGGWRIVTPGTVDIQASGITANCDITTSGDVKAGSVSLKKHVHSAVQTGGGSSGPPQ